jgi:uncharacterized OsmC-like protein
MSTAASTPHDPAFDLEIHQEDGFRFRVEFPGSSYPAVFMDEPAPLGKDSAPNPARILAAAIGNCLAASLLFCLQRRGVKAEGVHANVHMELVRNERKRLRVGRVSVTISKGTSEIPEDKLRACLDSFEDFCVVTQSVRAGIDVQVSVE